MTSQQTRLGQNETIIMIFAGDIIAVYANNENSDLTAYARTWITIFTVDMYNIEILRNL